MEYGMLGVLYGKMNSSERISKL